MTIRLDNSLKKSTADLLYLRLDTSNDPLTGDLDLGDNCLQNVECIDFNLTPSVTGQEGRLFWNSDEGTLNLGMPGGNVNLQVGQEVLIRAQNNEGVQIDNGQAVYISGATGANPQIMLANASETNGVQTIAIATEDILNNQFGYCTTFGLVRDVDTSAFSDGDILFLDATDGGITNVKLDHPNFRIRIGYCLRSHATEGVIFVNIKPDQWLKRFQSMQEPTGFDENQSTLRGDISFTNGTRTFAIDVQGGESYFNFWISGREFRKTSQETLVITDVEGLHYIYYDEDGALQEYVNPSDTIISQAIRTYPLVAIIYWDATNNEYIWFNDERHLNQMDGSTHAYLHFTRGTQWLSGGALGDFVIDDSGDTDDDAQFSYSLGLIADEDIVSQESNIASTVGLEIIYLSNGNWRRITESGFSVLTDTTAGIGVTGRLVYNDVSTPGSEILAVVPNNSFVLCHIIQTTGSESGEKVFAVLGQNSYGNIVTARIGANNEVNNLITSGLPGPEFIFLGSVIFQTADVYTNSVKARTRTTDEGDNYVDWRFTELSPAQPATDHGALSGLANDDHLQYLLLAGRSGGQVAYGGTDAGDDLELQSTSNSTKGIVLVNDNFEVGVAGEGESYSITNTGQQPGLTLNCERSSGGVAINFLEGNFKNTATTLDTDVFSFGVFGSVESGVTPPSAQYAYIGVDPYIDYNNTILKVDSESRVGIGITSSNRPFYTLDVWNRNNDNLFRLVRDASDQVVRVTETEFAINEDGDSDFDFRVEGTTDANLLFSDASADAIGIGTGTPSFGKLEVVGNVAIGGSNNELRFYEGSNYVGFEAPALTADQIWVLPDSDGSADDVLTTDGSGNLSWSAVSGTSEILNIVDGRLTLTTGTPVTTSDVTAATTVYFSPYKGNQISLYNTTGTIWEVLEFTEKSIDITDTQTGNTTNGSAVITGLTDTSQFIVGMEVTGTGIGTNAVISTIDSSTQVTLDTNSTADGTGVSITFKVPADTNLDIFGYDSSGSLVLEMVAWTNSTTRATALTKKDGIYVKTGELNKRYLGTCRTTIVSGECEDSSSAARFVWNYYNRVLRIMDTYDTLNWTQTSTSYTAAHGGDTDWRHEFVIGVSEDIIKCEAQVHAGNPTAGFRWSLGLDSTTSPAQDEPVNSLSTTNFMLRATFMDLVSDGYHYLNAIESVESGTATFYATSLGVQFGSMKSFLKG